MVLALVAALVGVSAAWFGDTTMTNQGGFAIESDTLQDAATIDISAAQGLDGLSIYPAVATPGYFLSGAKQPPIGAPLKSDTLPQGVDEAAVCATVYFPISFIGTADTGYEDENRKSLELILESANLKDESESENPYNYLDEFNVELSLVSVTKDESGQITDSTPLMTQTPPYANKLSGSEVFYDALDYEMYMLVIPGNTYYVKAVIYFNKIDEECNFDLLGEVVRFNFKLNILSDGSVIREHKYAEQGGETA